MGAWGPGNFENDDAMDWVAELESYTDDGPIFDALNTIIDRADDYPQPLDCSVAIAAAEVVAAQLDNPHEDYPEEIEAWTEGHPTPTATRIAQARQALEVIMAESGLRRSLRKNLPGNFTEILTEGNIALSILVNSLIEITSRKFGKIQMN